MSLEAFPRGTVSDGADVTFYRSIVFHNRELSADRKSSVADVWKPDALLLCLWRGFRRAWRTVMLRCWRAELLPRKREDNVLNSEGLRGP